MLWDCTVYFKMDTLYLSARIKNFKNEETSAFQLISTSAQGDLAQQWWTTKNDPKLGHIGGC